MKGKYLSLAMAMGLFAPVVYGKTKTLPAHEHGKAKLNISVEGNNAALEFESPAMDIVGFEHEAKKPGDKAKVEKALNSFKNDGAAMFVFGQDLKCVVTNTKAELVKEDHGEEDEKDHHDKKEKGKKHEEHGEHSEFQAQYAVKCEKPLAGSGLNVSLNKNFSSIKLVEVQVVSDSKQGSAQLKNGSGKVDL